MRYVSHQPFLLVAVGVALAFSTDARALDAAAAQQLARQSNCLKCHAVDKDKKTISISRYICKDCRSYLQKHGEKLDKDYSGWCKWLEEQIKAIKKRI
jgi:transposase-like protein